MNNYFGGLRFSKALKGGLIFFVLCLLLLRFVNLNADFPSNITKSAVLYTDEGWYSAAAVRHVLTGQWYMAGDVNTAVAQPFGQILHRISFAVFGMSLSSARTTIIVSFSFLMVLEALLVRRSFGNYAALLTVLLLACNYVGFAYSRLATMDLVATSFIVASLYVAGGLKSKSGLPRILFSSLLLGFGILTKTNAIFAVPLLAFLVWRSGSNIKERVVFLTATNLVIFVIVGGYLLVTKEIFPEDYALYNRATMGFMYTNINDWSWNLFHKMSGRIKVLGAGFVELTMLLSVLTLAVSKRFRSDPLVHLLFGYMVIYIGMLSVNSYEPPRYFLPLLVPLAGLFAIACVALFDRLHETKWPAYAIIPIILVVAVSLGGCWQIITYLSKPSFSFYQMAHAVGNIIQEREGTVHGVALFGDIADSVSLEIGTNALNSLLGTDQVMKIRKYHPKYMIVHTSNIVDIVISEGADVKELGAWDVFGNYYANGEQVRLYFVQWPGESDASSNGQFLFSRQESN